MSGDTSIDTNVFVDAGNPSADEFLPAGAFLAAFLDAPLTIAVDSGFSLNPSANKSLIGAEYLEHIQPMSVGYHVLVQLAASQRVVECTRRVSPALHKQVRALVKGSKPRDRTFLKIACVSTRKELVTHDFEDFQARKRKDIYRILGVTACKASEWCL